MGRRRMGRAGAAAGAMQQHAARHAAIDAAAAISASAPQQCEQPHVGEEHARQRARLAVDDVARGRGAGGVGAARGGGDEVGERTHIDGRQLRRRCRAAAVLDHQGRQPPQAVEVAAAAAPRFGVDESRRTLLLLLLPTRVCQERPPQRLGLFALPEQFIL